MIGKISADLLTKVFWEGIGLQFGKVIILLVLLVIAHRAVVSVVDRVVGLRMNIVGDEQQRRIHTLNGLFKIVLRIIFTFFGLVITLNACGIDTTSLLAGASIIGIAIGVGAQGLVKDFVAGMFIIMENQYAIGDIVTIKEFSGVVENITFRTTTVRSFDQILHTIPNGSIETVSNQTKGSYVSCIKIAVAQRADTEQVLRLLEQALAKVLQMPEAFEEGASVGGISDFAGNMVVYDVFIPSKRIDGYTIRNTYRYEVKKLFEEAKIPMPEYSMGQKMI